MAIDRDNVDWERIGRAVEEARLYHGWGKERAAREADVSSITLKRIEDGLKVQDGKLGAVLRALGLQMHFPGKRVGEVVSLGVEDWDRYEEEHPTNDDEVEALRARVAELEEKIADFYRERETPHTDEKSATRGESA